MEYILPIGSVILLKENKHRLMITGYLQKNREGTIYDYSAVPYPYGIGQKLQQACFNKDQIEGVISLGYQDLSYDVLSKKINDFMDEKGRESHE